MSLYNHPTLRQFVLQSVHPTGRRIGVGSYGTVEEVKIPGAICAAKKVHDLFQDYRQTESEWIEKTSPEFVRECQLMINLRHPHIVQFLGLCSLPDSWMPALVMEKMFTNLHEILDPEYPSKNNIYYLPLSLKFSILQGIASGVSFLHGHNPPIIHRDLSAKNVLLNEGMVAKIADLGMARIVPSLRAATMTKAPGTSIYMPPEALENQSRYDITIDIFSIGVLAIFTLSQKYPEPLSAAYMDSRRVMVGLTEFERRSKYMQLIHSQLHESHPLVNMIKRCLSNLPQDRPTVNGVLRYIEQAKAENIADEYDGNKLALVQSLNQKMKLIQSRDQLIDQKMKEIKSLKVEIEQMRKNVKPQQMQCKKVVPAVKRNNSTGIVTLTGNTVISSMEHQADTDDDYEYSNVVPTKKDQGIVPTKKDQGITSHVDTDDSEYYTVIPTPRPRIDRNDNKSSAENTKVVSTQPDNQRYTYQHTVIPTLKRTISCKGSTSSSRNVVLKWPLPLQWRKGKDMLISLCAASTVILDEVVYCGSNSHDVLRYITDSGEWSTLPPAPVKDLFMTSFLNQLVIAGSGNTGRDDRRISVWDKNRGKWIHPYPPMPTAVHQAAAIGYQEYLIVACGGRNKNTVEIFNSKTNTWHSAGSLPVGGNRISAVLSDKCWYLSSFGQWEDGKEHIFWTHLPSLISDTTSNYSNLEKLLWQELPTPPVRYSTLVTLQGHLLLVGGRKYTHRSQYEYVQSLHRYDQDNKKWRECGELPYGLWGACSAVLPSGDLMVAGGVTADGRLSNRLLFGLLQTLLVHM